MGIAVIERDRRVHICRPPARDREHFFRRVDARDDGALERKGDCGTARPGADVENRAARQRREELRDDALL